MNSTDLRFGAPQLEQLVLHQLARLHVERGERLVHQQDLRIEDQHLRERHALAHAARELVRIAVARSRRGRRARASRAPAPRASAARRAAELEPGGDVGERAAPRHQRVGLEHVAGVAVDARRAARRTRATLPDDGASSPAATLSSVDLPQPVGPTTETNSPGADRRASCPGPRCSGRPPALAPARAANVQVMRSSASAGAGGAARSPCALPDRRSSAVLLRRLLRERHVDRLREVDGRVLHGRVEAS